MILNLLHKFAVPLLENMHTLNVTPSVSAKNIVS